MVGSREGSPARAPTLACLPACILQRVLSCLPLADSARAACACKALAHAAAAAAAQCVTRLSSAAEWGLEQPSVEAVDFVCRACCKLQAVWLGPGANDDHLFALRRAPALEEVLLGGAEGCTDAGVAALLADAPFLSCVDAVSCEHVTHASVQLAAGRVLVRRLPQWFARAWRCMQHRHIPVGEIHTYHEEGTFTFTRNAQNAGWVASWRAAPPPLGSTEPPGHYQLVVRFSEEDAMDAGAGLQGWRPGICVRAEGLHHMRSAQRIWGLDHSAPETLPNADSHNVSTGFWQAVEEDVDATLDVAPAGAEEQ